MSTKTRENRLEALEAATKPKDARPLYYAVGSEAEITPDMRGAKVYIGVSPSDWDAPEDKTDE